MFLPNKISCSFLSILPLLVNLLFVQPSLGQRQQSNVNPTNPSTSTTDDLFKVSKPIKITIYYESLCPDSLDLLERQLVGILMPKKDASIDLPAQDILDIKLIPYGKATTQEISGHNSEKYYSFKCQHGPVECEGNKLHSCAIRTVSKYPERQTLQLVRFIICSMKYLMTKKPHTDIPVSLKSKNFSLLTSSALDSCVEELDPLINQTSLESSIKTEIENCLKSGEGNSLLKLNGDLTSQINPKLYWVPWVTFNGVWSKRLMDESFKDFRKVLCQLIISSKGSLESLETESTEAYIEFLGCKKYYPNYFNHRKLPADLIDSSTSSSQPKRNSKNINSNTNHNLEMIAAGPYTISTEGSETLSPTDETLEINRSRGGRGISINSDKMLTNGAKHRFIRMDMGHGAPYGWRFIGNQGRGDWRWRRPMMMNH